MKQQNEKKNTDLAEKKKILHKEKEEMEKTKAGHENEMEMLQISNKD